MTTTSSTAGGPFEERLLLTMLEALYSGKVREMYDLERVGTEGPTLLMVASDRISTYDAVHPTPIPDKGKVLTGLSVFWFERTEQIVANHLVSTVAGVPLEVLGRETVLSQFAGHKMVHRIARPA